MTIQKSWKKALAVASLAVVTAAAMPALSQARTHYTGKTPPTIAMMASPFEPMEPAVKHTRTVSNKHKVVKTSAKKGVSKKHKKLSTAALKHKAKKSPAKKKI